MSETKNSYLAHRGRAKTICFFKINNTILRSTKKMEPVERVPFKDLPFKTYQGVRVGNYDS